MTCRDCTHWRQHEPLLGDEGHLVASPRGDCDVVGIGVKVGNWPGPPRRFVTLSTFGCVYASTAAAAGDDAHARAGDPDTSHAAARTIDRLNPRRIDVLRTLHHPMTDLVLVAQHAHGGTGIGDEPGRIKQTASGVRSRRAELVTLGLVAHVDTIKVGNRKHRVWARTPAGEHAARTGELS